ncbi:MAG: diacylglycerol kinase [Deltaproteobacteria bacterium]|jgi:diacylglycerol kinase (ATP)|nr:diacylglycerol kinase [Deltaproteobacteria bacterium]
MLKTLKNLPRRARKAMMYSLQGLWAAFRKEEAVKLEFLSLLILVLILSAVEWVFWKKLTLVAVFLLIPLTELFNSAVEDICDLVSPEFNPKVRDAKDKGSAAVLLAIIISLLTLWGLLSMP